MKLSEELKWRGMVNQTTLADLSVLDNEKITFYQGFDASAPSQTIGNLAAMMVSMTLLRHGHTGIILAGGSTSLIGDPGGKDTERPMQTPEIIADNINKAQHQLKTIYHQYPITLVNNIDWTYDISVISFLRDIGKFFNVGEMIKRDYITNRIGEGGTGISYTEFSYSLLQGLDYLHLYQKYNCTLQIGGSDQWSNCLSGVELIRRKLGAEVHVLTLPLVIDKTTGKKFGKSESGAVWLDEKMTSPYDFYQFWIGVDDEGVLDYIKFYTDIMPDAYDELMNTFNNDRSTRLAQKYLAYAVTKLVHGSDEADKARSTSESLFGGVMDLNSSDLPTYEISSYCADNQLDMVAMLTGTEILSSKREARDMIDGGGVYIDDMPISGYSVSIIGLPAEFLLRIGKKKYYKIVLQK